MQVDILRRLRDFIELQWSRFFSKRKIALARLANLDSRALQWSRFFSKRKMAYRCPVPLASLSDFNGAAFFQSGKYCGNVAAISEPIVTSMEPLFFKAENRTKPTRRRP